MNTDRPLIYLAAPFTSKNDVEKQKRHEAVVQATKRMMLQGHVLYSPIAIGPEIEKDINWRHEEWMDYDRNILRNCEQLWVLKLPGWEKSRGVLQEIEMAGEFGIPIHFIEPMTYVQIDKLNDLFLVHQMTNNPA